MRKSLPTAFSAREGRDSRSRWTSSRPRAHRRLVWQRTAILGAIAILVVIVLGLVFAGSPSRLADGVRIAGIDVGGKTPGEARAVLERKARELASLDRKSTR